MEIYKRKGFVSGIWYQRVLYKHISVEFYDVIKHKVLLENLQPNTTYHYRVTSVDESGTKWVSADFSFTTLP
jgi:Purple acid Phosphatase, N-terminal domain